MKYTVENGALNLYFEGKIDSSKAPTVAQEADAILSENPLEDVVINAEDLEYMTSAALRVVLNIRKKKPSLKMINVSTEVYEILDMTGFTEMMTVEKAYRVIDVEGCEVIGQGANGKVYRLDPDTIAKVYLNPDALPDIQKERELARRAFVLGVNTAIPFDVVKVRGGGFASVFELLNAKTLAKLASTEPDKIDTFIDYSVDLLKVIHSKVVRPDDMPNMKTVAIGWAEFTKDYLPAEAGEKLVRLVKAVPDDLHMMHGDYHLKNVMIQNGEALLIDMDTLCYGAPIFEFASIFNAYEGFSVLDHSVAQSFLGISYEQAAYVLKETFIRYFGTTDEAKLEELKNKAKVMGYTRLLRRCIRRGALEKDPQMVECYRQNLLDALSKVEDLNL